MTWLCETAVRTGPLNHLVGTHLSPAARLGQAIAADLRATGGQGPTAVSATERLAARMRAQAAAVVVSPGLHEGYLDLTLFGSDEGRTARALHSALDAVDGPVLLRSASGFTCLTPAGEGAGTYPLTAVPAGDLDALLDTVTAAGPAAPLLRLDAHQLATTTHPLVAAETTRLELVVAASTGVDVIARLAGRRPRLHGLEVELDAGMLSVAKASLLATVAGQLDHLRFTWAPADDDVVRTTVVPQIALAFRDVPAFRSWADDLARNLVLPFEILARDAPAEGRRAVVASAVEHIPPELLGTETVIYAPATGIDVGQRDVRFDDEQLSDATVMRVGAHSLRLLPYAAPRPAGADPAVRHLRSADDLEAFRQDAEKARRTGVWSAAAAELESDAHLLDRDAAAEPRVMFCDAAGVRSTRLLTDGQPADPPERWWGAYATALRLRRRFGDDTAVTGFPAGADGSDWVAGRWIVGRRADQAVLAEIGGRRRVFQVPDWLAALVDAVQSGGPRDEAIGVAARRAGSTAAECERLLLELAA